MAHVSHKSSFKYLIWRNLLWHSSTVQIYPVLMINISWFSSDQLGICGLIEENNFKWQYNSSCGIALDVSRWWVNFYLQKPAFHFHSPGEMGQSNWTSLKSLGFARVISENITCEDWRLIIFLLWNSDQMFSSASSDNLGTA